MPEGQEPYRGRIPTWVRTRSPPRPRSTGSVLPAALRTAATPGSSSSTSPR